MKPTEDLAGAVPLKHFNRNQLIFTLVVAVVMIGIMVCRVLF
jgi:hypothetical protein